MRRQIMALVVGLTTLVILAFAIPVALLIRSSVVQKRRARGRDQRTTWR